MYKQIKKWPVPGFAWAALLVLATAVLHTYFEQAFWFDAALLTLAGIARALDLKWERIVAVAEEFSADSSAESSSVGAARGAQQATVFTKTQYMAEVQPGRAMQVMRWLGGG